jgi:flavorubredoxin
MPTTNTQSGTRIDEIADGIYRIATPMAAAQFSFSQFLIADEQPLLFHTGPRMFARLTQEAVATVLPVASLRWIAFSHFEADECGAINELLAAAPRATGACGAVGAMVNGDSVDRGPRGLADGEVLELGRHRLRWVAAPHVPHGWDCGFLFDETTRTLLCGDLFTQAGAEHAPVVESDILGPSEGFRKVMDYYAHAPETRATLERMAALAPATLACMHGSSWRGDGGALLRALADELSAASA